MIYLYFKKYINIFIIALLLSSATSCGGGFYAPYTVRTEVPDGPPEYKSGFRAGCRSGLSSSRKFANAYVYGVSYGSGAYHHDQRFIDGWQHGMFSCVIQAAVFVRSSSGEFAPLQ